MRNLVSLILNNFKLIRFQKIVDATLSLIDFGNCACLRVFLGCTDMKLFFKILKARYDKLQKSKEARWFFQKKTFVL